MLSAQKSFLIDAHIEVEENVFPMVPAGAALDEMMIRFHG
jgi:thiamine pyrophosphate-dependent acetolactate synthase large subunit-like protein